MAPELVEGRFRARRFMHKYNSHFPDDATPDSLAADRETMLEQQFGRVGKNVFIEPPLNIDYGCNISLGDDFYSNFKYAPSTLPLYLCHGHPPRHTNVLHLPPKSLVILDCGMVKIGNRVLFGPFVSIFAATHETGVQSRRDGVEYAKPVSIGDDCWIGGNVTIMPGVTIGKGCTVAAGSIVTRDVPDFSVAVGTPARVVKKVEPVPDILGTHVGSTAKGIPEP